MEVGRERDGVKEMNCEKKNRAGLNERNRERAGLREKKEVEGIERDGVLVKN